MGNLIFGFFRSIFETGKLIIVFIDRLINGLSSISDNLDLAFSNLSNLFSWLPDSVFVTISSIVCIVVTYKLLGREG